MRLVFTTSNFQTNIVALLGGLAPSEGFALPPAAPKKTADTAATQESVPPRACDGRLQQETLYPRL